jgi:hypothetical protein
VIDMQFGVHAQQRHYERIQHALGPRPEPYGRIVASPTKRSPSLWPRIVRRALASALQSLVTPMARLRVRRRPRAPTC